MHRLHFLDVVEWFILDLHGRFLHPIGLLATSSSPTSSAPVSSYLWFLPRLRNMDLL